MNRRHLAALLTTVLVAGCSALPHAPGPGDLGVPTAIGDWTVSNVTPDPQTDFGKALSELASVFIDAAGGTSSTGAWGVFEVRDASGMLVTRVDGYRVIDAKPDALLRGADSVGFIDLVPAGITSGGWDLRGVSDGGGWVAVRNDRLFTFPGGPGGPTRDQIQRFLDGLT